MATSMAATSNASYLTRRLLRNVLREASKNSNTSFKHSNNQWRSNVVAQFRKHKDESEPNQLKTLKQLGDTFLCMIRNMREHHVCLF